MHQNLHKWTTIEQTLGVEQAEVTAQIDDPKATNLPTVRTDFFKSYSVVTISCRALMFLLTACYNELTLTINILTSPNTVIPTSFQSSFVFIVWSTNPVIS
jgi:hypothetical protein